MTNVGWIGLGAMGSPMASFVAEAGHTVTAFDIDPQKAATLAEEGVKAAATVSYAAAHADVLVLMVATAGQAESVLFGDDKAAAALKPGSVVLLMATVGPAAVEDWARRLAVSGVEIVDAPVSGGAARAGRGDLLIMVSGSETALAAVQPLLDVMARDAPVVGTEPGEGQKVKLVNQLLCGAHRGRRGSPCVRRSSRTGRRRHLGSAPARRCRIVHARRPGRPDGRQPDQRDPVHHRHLRQGHGSGHRSGSGEGVPNPAGVGGRAALPRRSPGRPRAIR